VLKKKKMGCYFLFIFSLFPLTLYYHRHWEKVQQKEKKVLGNWGQRGKEEGIWANDFFYY